MSSKKITKEMSVASLIENTPIAKDIMLRYGMRFTGKDISPFEPMEKVAKENGLTDKDIESIINEINSYSAEKFWMNLTKNAADKLREMLIKKETEAIRLRLYHDGGVDMYDMDFTGTKTENDIETHSNGVKFFVDKKSANLLKGTLIDYDSEEDGFVFKNPNVKRK